MIFHNPGYTLNRRPGTVDLFCGAGGLSEGFKRAGFDSLLGIDSDKWAVATYRQHHGRAERKHIQDVNADYIFKTTGTEEIDVILGGPPCQAFSSIAVAKWRALGIPSTVKPQKGMFALP